MSNNHPKLVLGIRIGAGSVWVELFLWQFVKELEAMFVSLDYRVVQSWTIIISVKSIGLRHWQAFVHF